MNNPIIYALSGNFDPNRDDKKIYMDIYNEYHSLEKRNPVIGLINTGVLLQLNEKDWTYDYIRSFEKNFHNLNCETLVVRHEDSDNLDHIKWVIENSDILYFLGGNYFKNYQFIEKRFREKILKKRMLIGTSLGAMFLTLFEDFIFDEYVKKDGLKLYENYVVCPHADFTALKIKGRTLNYQKNYFQLIDYFSKNRINKDVFLIYRNGGIRIGSNSDINVIVGHENELVNAVAHCKIRNGNIYVDLHNGFKSIHINYKEMKHLLSNHIIHF